MTEIVYEKVEPVKSLCVSNLPEDERPYSRIKRYGAGSLTDNELYSIILSKGKKILDVKGNINGHLQHCTLCELINNGFTEDEALHLMAIAEISKRLWHQQADDRLPLKTPEKLAEYCMQEIAHNEQECLMAIFLDSSCRPVISEILTIGTADSSLVSVRDLLVHALKHRATRLAIAHQHPVGTSSPSSDDMDVTRRVKEGCTAVGISMIDHVILSPDGSFYSFREKGLV